MVTFAPPPAGRAVPDRDQDLTLWHVPISHFSEKARWALDHKGVRHTRRALLGGTHPVVAWFLTRGRHHTVPVLTIDGSAIGDSTAIIAALEARFPERPLYPADAEERRRALELEQWFDEELGPFIRRWGYHTLLSDDDARRELTRKQVPWVHPAAIGVASAGMRAFMDARFGTGSAEGARFAEEKVMAALERLEGELAGRDFLCGDAFSVADLTAASLFYGLALPEEGPWRPENVPAAWENRRDSLRERRGYQWILDIYASHRRPAHGRTAKTVVGADASD